MADCSADQPVAGPHQPTANPKAKTRRGKYCCCIARGNQIQLGRYAVAARKVVQEKNHQVKSEIAQIVRMSTNSTKESTIFPRHSFHIQSMSSQPKSADILRDILRQIQMQVPR
eukprot:1138760-Pelagomonas_calceolata.AAC.2